MRTVLIRFIAPAVAGIILGIVIAILIPPAFIPNIKGVFNSIGSGCMPGR